MLRWACPLKCYTELVHDLITENMLKLIVKEASFFKGNNADGLISFCFLRLAASDYFNAGCILF